MLAPPPHPTSYLIDTTPSPGIPPNWGAVERTAQFYFRNKDGTSKAVVAISGCIQVAVRDKVSLPATGNWERLDGDVKILAFLLSAAWDLDSDVSLEKYKKASRSITVAFRLVETDLDAWAVGYQAGENALKNAELFGHSTVQKAKKFERALKMLQMTNKDAGLKELAEALATRVREADETDRPDNHDAEGEELSCNCNSFVEKIRSHLFFLQACRGADVLSLVEDCERLVGKSCIFSKYSMAAVIIRAALGNSDHVKTLALLVETHPSPLACCRQ